MVLQICRTQLTKDKARSFATAQKRYTGVGENYVVYQFVLLKHVNLRIGTFNTCEVKAIVRNNVC